MAGIYSFNKPEQLFEKLVKSYTAFCDFPSEDRIFDVIFPLYHLREWICPAKYFLYKDKPAAERTPEENFSAQLHAMAEYRIVRDICNYAKHYETIGPHDLADRSAKLEGFRAGFGRVGDRLNVTHYLVDGHELRDIFWPVYLAYFNYFNKT